MIALTLLISCSETKPSTQADSDKPWINDPTVGPYDPEDSLDADSSEIPSSDSGADQTDDETDQDGDGYSVLIDCDDNDDWLIPQETTVALPLFRCGSGQALHNIESSQDWNSTLNSGTLTFGEVGGCIGQALELNYSLDASLNPASIEASRSFPAVDIGGKSFLGIPFVGDTTAEPSDITFRISDGSCIGSYKLPESSHLGAWRTAIVPIQRFSGVGCAPNLTSIESFSVTLSTDSGQRSGTLSIDDISAINTSDLTPDIRTQFCPPTEVDTELDLLASALVESVQEAQSTNGHPFPETWSGQKTRGTYAIAMTLTALSVEYSRRQSPEALQAATDLAEGLLALDRHSSGVWYEFYDENLTPVDDGNAPKSRHVSWVVIALHQFILKVQPSDPTGYQLAMFGASDWLRIQQQTFSTDFPQWGGGLSRASEDNLAAYFALVSTAAQDPTNLAGSATIGMGQFLWGKLWDVNQLRLRSGVTDGGFSSSVGAWGTQFLNHHNHPREAIFNLAFTSGFLSVASWNENFNGYALNEGPFQPSWEATGMMASTGGANAAIYLQERLNGYTGGLLNGTENVYLDPTQSLPGLQPTAWVYLGLYGDILSDL